MCWTSSGARFNRVGIHAGNVDLDAGPNVVAMDHLQSEFLGVGDFIDIMHSCLEPCLDVLVVDELDCALFVAEDDNRSTCLNSEVLHVMTYCEPVHLHAMVQVGFVFVL